MTIRLLIVGRFGGTHLGASFLQGANDFTPNTIITQVVDTQVAYKSAKLITKINWHLLGKRPPHISYFNQQLCKTCDEFQPDCILVTGISPLTKKTLQQVFGLGIRTINFLTDDPWNPAHQARWFLDALPHYSTVFSPRRVIIDELKQIGCQDVRYLPFGYDPHLFYPVSPTPREYNTHVSDVMFAGGGDRDRVPYISALITAGIKVGLYGGYWERYPETKPYNRGLADTHTLRVAIHSAKIALCLVRRANRDSHVMRSFEVPAVGACMLTEDTQDHRDFFGREGECVIYFNTIPEMIEKTRWLLEHPDERRRLSLAVHKLIVEGKHTYSDRLRTILLSHSIE